MTLSTANGAPRMVDDNMQKLFKTETIILITILLIASFMRLYRVRDYIVFLGDEGRDVMVVRNILRGNLTLLGPTASVGGFYLGPIYYYMMAPPLFLSGYDPAGPAYLISLLGIATVFLIYLFGKRLYHPIVGLSAAFLYAISPLIVRYSRASWNPNPLPFFTLLGMYFLYLATEKKAKKYYFLAGACLGVAWQLHYLALILTAVYIAIILCYTQRHHLLSKIYHLISVIAGWAVTFSPFLAFEIRHQFPNTRTVTEFITRPKGAIDLKLIDIITTFWMRLTRLFFEAYTLPNSSIVMAIAVIGVLALLWASTKKNKTLVLWTLVGLVGMSLYQGDIHNYYFGFLFPVPFLITGILFYLLWKKAIIGKLLALGFMLFLAGIYLDKAFFQILPNRLIDQTQNTAEIGVDMAQGNPYNFALIATGNSDHAYRYFMDISSNPPTPLETQVTEQLIIICEQRLETCQPLGNPTWEIAGFGRAEIIDTKTDLVGGLTIFKLIHHPESQHMIGRPATKG